MGNHMSCLSPAAAQRLASPLVQSNIIFCHYQTGQTSELQGPITAAEAMIEFPAHFLCSLSTVVSADLGCGRRICPVPADEELHAAELYLLLPMHRLNSRFSTEEIAFLTSLEAAWKSNGVKMLMKGPISQRRVAPSPTASPVSVPRMQSEAEVTFAMMSQPAKPLQSMSLELRMGAGKNGMCRSKSWMPKLATVDEVTVAL